MPRRYLRCAVRLNSGVMRGRRRVFGWARQSLRSHSRLSSPEQEQATQPPFVFARPGGFPHPKPDRLKITRVARLRSPAPLHNESFKPTPLRDVVVTSLHPSAPASATLPQRRGLIQALCAAGEESLAGPRPSATTGRRAGPRGRDSLRSAVASATLSPKLARAKAGNAAAVFHRLTRRILASRPFSP